MIPKKKDGQSEEIVQPTTKVKIGVFSSTLSHPNRLLGSTLWYCLAQQRVFDYSIAEQQYRCNLETSALESEMLLQIEGSIF